MQSLDRRVTFLESASSRERRLERMTDAELDERIATLLAQWHQMTGRAPAAASSSNLESQHAKP